MMDYTINRLNNVTIEYQLLKNDQPLTVEQWLFSMVNEGDFRLAFNNLLQETPFEAYLWETPPVTSSTLTKPFKFAAVKNTFLENVTPTPQTFAEHFSSGDKVATFPNLGGDALLVVPAKIAPDKDYPHLAVFTRTAPEHQVDAFWQQVSEVYENEIGTTPKWLSTNGLGVFWLHARIDTQPKYYHHQPYRQFDT